MNETVSEDKTLQSVFENLTEDEKKKIINLAQKSIMQTMSSINEKKSQSLYTKTPIEKRRKKNNIVKKSQKLSRRNNRNKEGPQEKLIKNQSNSR